MKTIHELPANLFERARPILGSPPADFAYIDSALTGTSPARVFVDDPDQPTAALLRRTYEYFVGGTPGTDLDAFISDAPTEPGIWSDFYGFVAVDPIWNDHLCTLQPNLETIGRRSFRYDSERIGNVHGWQQRVPVGVEIVSLSRELAEVADREMPEIIGMFWDGYDNYEQYGFGAVALVDGHPVSLTYAVAVGGGEANVGVMTVPSQRRRGLATLCSQACVEMAHQRALIATWDCDEPNIASASLAQEIGFIEYESFAELAFPDRTKPGQSADVWSSTPCENGTTVWSRE